MNQATSQLQVEEIKPDEMISLRHVPTPEDEKPEPFKRTEVEEVPHDEVPKVPQLLRMPLFQQSNYFNTATFSQLRFFS